MIKLPKAVVKKLENDTRTRDPEVISSGRKSETLEESIARVRRAIAESKEEKKMYSIRLKVKTVDALKRKAAAAGIPYQTYMNVLLDNAAMS
jgi:predicted DNA binding CopG/RHH family protein